MKNFNRRDFLKTSILAGTGMMLLPSCMAQEGLATGIQLYTLRDFMNDNPESTLNRLAEIGYKEIELAGYSDGKFYGMDPSTFQKLVRDAGLEIVSGHYQTGKLFPEQKGTLMNGWEKAVEDAVAIDQEYMVLAYLHDGERKSINDYYELVKLINTCAQKAKDAGLQFAYHNHAFEFEKLDGKVPFDILLSETDADLVKIELDLYWTVKAGYDPVALFEKDPGRYVLWHVKDMDAEGNFTAVGTGTIDYQKIFNHRDTAGMKHFFVEQDQINGDKWESVKTSYRNVKKVI